MHESRNGVVAFYVRGDVDGYDVEGDGTCLTTALIAYAADCRKAAANYQQLAAQLLVEAARADAAARAAEQVSDALEVRP